MRVGICSNGVMINTNQMRKLREIGNVHVNVSLDGFRPESHGRFRGDEDSFEKTIKTIRQLSRYNLLQGILVTPNAFASNKEYADICDFAIRNKATYVLMNPLSRMGRGEKSKKKLGLSDSAMRDIKRITSKFGDHIQIVYIRFPNDDGLPLGRCEAGNIIYVFVNGDLTVCPYLVFAARGSGSKYNPEKFVVGNIIKDSNITEKLDGYRLPKSYLTKEGLVCSSCSLRSKCGGGCPAAVIASKRWIGDIDREMCPVISFDEDVTGDDGNG